MALKEDAKYEHGLTCILFQMRNDDQSEALPDNTIGGVGPFDFSGVADPSAVPMSFKIDTGAVETIDLDFTTPAVADIAAVTVAEVIAAINAESPTNITASAEAVTGRLKIVASTGTRFQVYGVAAELSMIGQGYGTRIVMTNTMENIDTSPNQKEDETHTVTDANGVDVEVIIPGYRKGVNGSWVDNANDFLIRRIFEGGTIDSVTGEYSAPTVATVKGAFIIEFYTAFYLVGTNKKVDLNSYGRQRILSAIGSYGDRSYLNDFSKANYNYTATSPKVAGVILPDSKELPLTVAEYTALQLESIPA